MYMNVKFSDALLGKEFTFKTNKELVVSYHTNILDEFEMFLSYYHPAGVNIVPKLEDFVQQMSQSSGIDIEITFEDGTILKSVRGNIKEYVFRSQLNFETNKMEPREQITIVIFK